MSGWLILTRNLHRLGGGPLRLQQFDAGSTGRPHKDANLACHYGVMRLLRGSAPRQHELTPLGEALCEGRARVVRAGPGGAVSVRSELCYTVPDDMIVRALIAAGMVAGAQVTPTLMRLFAVQLGAEFRQAVRV